MHYAGQVQPPNLSQKTTMLGKIGRAFLSPLGFGMFGDRSRGDSQKSRSQAEALLASEPEAGASKHGSTIPATPSSPLQVSYFAHPTSSKNAVHSPLAASACTVAVCLRS